MERKAVQIAKNTMFLEGKIAQSDEKINLWLRRSGKTAEELRQNGVNAIGFFPTKIVAYYNFKWIDACVDKVEILYKEAVSA
jgi:hypothetical protein